MSDDEDIPTRPVDPQAVDPQAVDPQLVDRLRSEFGDPGDAADRTDGLADGWPGVERLARGQAQRRRAAGAGAAAAVVLLGVAVALVLSGRHADRTSLATAAAPTTRPASSSSSEPGTSNPDTSTSMVLLPVITSPGLGPVTTFPVKNPVTTVPTGPVTTPSTAAPTTSAAPPIDCGTAYLASGWPTTTVGSPAQAACILDAFAAGTPATYVVRAQTDGEGGHIQITTYRVVGVQRVQRTVDDRGAQPAGGVTTTTCTGLAASMETAVVASGCS